MAQTRLTVEGDVLSLVILVGQSPAEVHLELEEDTTMADARSLSAMLEHHVVGMRIKDSSPQPLKTQESTVVLRNDWHTQLVTCPCGKSFPKHGLGGLGKHAASCPQSEKIQVQSAHGTVYLPYLKAIKSWLNSHPFTVKDMMHHFQAVYVPISYSGVRTHLDHLVDVGELTSTKVGRGRQYVRPDGVRV